VKRDLDTLTSMPFDVLVVGGGILGACIARDAALRGLAVALVETRDFASGTSSNSLKIVHGGLRYLQHLDFRRMRESIRERSTWLRIAPHLVEPLPILVPAYRYGVQSRVLLRAATALSDALAWDRNRGLLPDRTLPPSRLISRRECLDLAPELARPDLTGGLLFYDAQMYSSERLVLEMLQGACDAGAVIANYVELESLISGDKCASIFQARDSIRGHRLEISARMLVNAAGPAAPTLAAKLTGHPHAAPSAYSVALNVMIERPGHSVAFSMQTKPKDADARARLGTRQLFIVPWRGCTIIGTGHYPYGGDCVDFSLAERDLDTFLAEVNTTWAGKPLKPEEITSVHAGLLPVAPGSAGPSVRLLKRHRIIDHAADGAPSVISAISVKYTTARLAAEIVVDLLLKKLGLARRPCRTGSTLLTGAPTTAIGQLSAEARRRHGTLLDDDILEHLVRTYGARYERILAYQHSVPDWKQQVSSSSPVIRAQLVHAVREEMALRTEDLVFRRTELGTRGTVPDSAMRFAAEVLSGEAMPTGRRVAPPPKARQA
jgi:glycerol-3-phosphate dehydrogenase